MLLAYRVIVKISLEYRYCIFLRIIEVRFLTFIEGSMKVELMVTKRDDDDNQQPTG